MSHIDQRALTAAMQRSDVVRLPELSSQTGNEREDFGASGAKPFSKCTRPPDRLYSTNWRLFADPEPPLGSHIVTPRRGYLHHGIYVGAGKVVHYAGLARGFYRRPVEETTLDRFARGRPVWVRCDRPPTFTSREVIGRARSRMGEDGYRLFTNNCEHFCEWCLYGEHRSYQVDAWLTRPGRALQGAFRLIGRWLPAPGRIGLRPVRASAAGAG
jgi:lecithin:retinol acyltransferase